VYFVVLQRSVTFGADVWQNDEEIASLRIGVSIAIFEKAE